MVDGSKRRIESPTSILTYMQCPRKYFYRYVRGLEAKPSIHLVLGSIVHSALQDFHRTDTKIIPPENFFETLRSNTINFLNKRWEESKVELEKLKITPQEIGLTEFPFKV